MKLEQLHQLNLIDKKNLLLKYYYQIGLNENELVTVLLIDYLLDQGYRIVDNNILSEYMSLSKEKIDLVLLNLTNKGLIRFEKQNNMLTINLSQIYTKIFALIEVNKLHETKKEKQELNNNIITLFTNEFNRNLSPMEIEIIREWLQAGFSNENIIYALREAVMSNALNFRYIEKVLVSNK